MRDSVLDRFLLVLSCFSAEHYALSAKDLAKHTGLPLSTIHRILTSMVGKGLLSKVTGYKYVIGSRLWELGELSPLSLILRENATPHLLRLYEATGENVHLAVLDGPSPAKSSALFVGRVTGKKSIPTVSRAGGRDPLHATGVGKALLAGQDDTWLEDFLADPLLPETTKTITDPDVLLADLRLIRKRGYAFTEEEMTLDNISVAARLSPLDGLPPIAVGVVVRAKNANVQFLASAVQQAAKDIRDSVVNSRLI